jgi:hypothetical protein
MKTNIVRKKRGVLLEPSRVISLEVNIQKTKYMIVSRHQNARRSQNLLTASNLLKMWQNSSIWKNSNKSKLHPQKH